MQHSPRSTGEFQRSSQLPVQVGRPDSGAPWSLDSLLVSALRWYAPAWPLRGREIVDRTRAEVKEALSLYAEAGWLAHPERLYEKPPAPRSPRLERSLPGPFGYETLRFESGYLPGSGDPGAALWSSYPGNSEARAWLLRDPGGPRRPWLLCIHGYGMGLPWIDIPAFRARELQRSLGVNVAGYVMPFHGPRARGSQGASELVTRGVSNVVHCFAQAVWDLRRLLAWIRGQGGSRIGLHGISLGSTPAALLAGLDAELRGVLLGVPAMDFTAGFRMALSEGAPAEVPAEDDEVWSEIRRLLGVVSPLQMTPLLEPDRLAIYAGRSDALADADSVAALARHWGNPTTAWYSGGHFGFLVDRTARELTRSSIGSWLQG